MQKCRWFISGFGRWLESTWNFARSKQLNSRKRMQKKVSPEKSPDTKTKHVSELWLELIWYYIEKQNQRITFRRVDEYFKMPASAHLYPFVSLGFEVFFEKKMWALHLPWVCPAFQNPAGCDRTVPFSASAVDGHAPWVCLNMFTWMIYVKQQTQQKTP